MQKNNKRNKKWVTNPVKIVGKGSIKTLNQRIVFNKILVANFFSFIWNVVDGAEKISYIFDLF